MIPGDMVILQIKVCGQKNMLMSYPSQRLRSQDVVRVSQSRKATKAYYRDSNFQDGKSAKKGDLYFTGDTTKRLMSSPKCRSVEVINNPARPGSNHREVNCINYK
jgi:hypothetical protein